MSMPRSRGSKRQSNLDYAPTYSDRERLGAVLRSELAHQMPYVNLDRLLGDKKSFPNITVAIASGDLLEDFDLAWCESRVAKVVDNMRQQIVRNALVPCVHVPNRPHQI